MTPIEIEFLIDRHLNGWLGSGSARDGAGELRSRIAAAISEVIASRDKLWLDGSATLRHERDAALIYRTEHKKSIAACMWMHDDKTLDIPLGGLLTSDGVTALRKQRDELRAQLAAMTQARDDAIAAAHLIHESRP